MSSTTCANSARRPVLPPRETGGAAAGTQEGPFGEKRALRAYAHPVRMKLVGLLRAEGPLTATRAAELLGESSGTCSFRTRAQGARAGRYLLRAPAQAGTAAAGRAADQLLKTLRRVRPGEVLAQHRTTAARAWDLLEPGLPVELAGAHVPVGLPVG